MDEEDRIPLSYIAQYGYCPRRAGLLINEQVWADNEYTAAGSAAHERVHTARTEKRGEMVKLYEYTVFSNAMGVSGKCDCIEAALSDVGCRMPFSQERYVLYPIEYKHGSVREEREYQMQLCAQAMCLEDMYKAEIPRGALFFIDAHRRDEVDFTPELRKEVLAAVKALEEIVSSGRVPAPHYGPRCKKCSLKEHCQPQAKTSAAAYVKAVREQACTKEGGEP